jgi:hypothetical protein
VIAPGRVAAAIDARFDADGDDISVVRFAQPTNVHLNVDELIEQGHTVADVAMFVQQLRKAQVAAPQYPLSPAAGQEPAFLAAYPSALLPSLSCLPPDDH